MKLHKLIKREIRRDGKTGQVVGDVNAAIAANVNEPGPSRTHVSSRQRIVQRSGRRSGPEQAEATGESSEPTSG
jgi:hypothetical protein